jgi:hypothetical protein
MKIVIATPLYPPDIAEPAPYVKELAKRLTTQHEITIVAYSHIPEKIPGVRIVAVDKRRPILNRLFSYTRTLLHEARSTDLIYAENGASVELPLVFISFLVRQPIIFHRGDRAAHVRATNRPLLRLIERAAEQSARAIITDMPLPKPEIIPFSKLTPAETEKYERSWDEHLALLRKTFTYGK